MFKFAAFKDLTHNKAKQGKDLIERQLCQIELSIWYMCKTTNDISIIYIKNVFQRFSPYNEQSFPWIHQFSKGVKVQKLCLGLLAPIMNLFSTHWF